MNVNKKSIILHENIFAMYIKSKFTTLMVVILFVSCEKDFMKSENTKHLISNDGIEMRQGLQDDGYYEVVVDSILKIDCYFQDWDKTIATPVSGMFEYYDVNDNWVASIDFGDGSCDQWAIKTWDVNVFPDYPSGIENFSVFE